MPTYSQKISAPQLILSLASGLVRTSWWTVRAVLRVVFMLLKVGVLIALAVAVAACAGLEAATPPATPTELPTVNASPAATSEPIATPVPTTAPTEVPPTPEPAPTPDPRLIEAEQVALEVFEELLLLVDDPQNADLTVLLDYEGDEGQPSHGFALALTAELLEDNRRLPIEGSRWELSETRWHPAYEEGLVAQVDICVDGASDWQDIDTGEVLITTSSAPSIVQYDMIVSGTTVGAYRERIDGEEISCVISASAKGYAQ